MGPKIMDRLDMDMWLSSENCDILSTIISLVRQL